MGWRRLYAAYMQSPQWAAMRRQALARESQCRVCHREDDLHVHHITYERFTRELLEDLMVLCRTHHEQVHELARATKMSVANATKQFMQSCDLGPIIREPQGTLDESKSKRPRSASKGSRSKRSLRGTFIMGRSPAVCVRCRAILLSGERVRFTSGKYRGNRRPLRHDRCPSKAMPP